MRRLFLLAALWVVPAFAATGQQRIFDDRLWTEAQALTRAAPTLVTEGIAMAPANGAPVVGYSVVIQAAEGQTLSGAGTLPLYVYDATFGWHLYGDTTLDITSLASCAGKRTCEFAGFQVFAPYPGTRFLYAATGVTVSGGTTVTVAIKGSVDLAQTVYP